MFFNIYAGIKISVVDGIAYTFGRFECSARIGYQDELNIKGGLGYCFFNGKELYPLRKKRHPDFPLQDDVSCMPVEYGDFHKLKIMI